MTVVAVGLVFLAVSLTVLGLGRHLSGRPTRDQRMAVTRLRDLSRPADAPADPEPKLGLAEVVSRFGRWLAPRDGAKAADLTARLSQAGYRHPSAAVYFTGIQMLLVLVLAAAGGGVAAVGGKGWPKALMWAACGGGAGLIGPSFVLSSQLKKRQRELRSALPDALDVLVLSVEGGASLNAAINWVAEEIPPAHPVLGAEMVMVHREVQLGLSAGEAFGAFADRCGLPEARDLAAALVQSERYGASIGKALRSYSDAARQERQLWAEEIAQKAAVKIIFPMLLCIFPAMFIVLLGPAAVQMSTIFANR